LTPKKEWVHKKGIEPDIKVERTEDDFNNNRDPQLDKAIELAKEI
jgi:C-terminal processing protease CtpA/Prc